MLKIISRTASAFFSQPGWEDLQVNVQSMRSKMERYSTGLISKRFLYNRYRV